MFNIDEQRIALSKLPDKRFIQRKPEVKGAFTSGNYVIYMLNTILGPDNWRHTISHGPEIVRLSESQAYVQCTIRIDAQFANGQQVTHEDVGVWPLAATNAKNGGTLDDTAPDRYETVLKACVTDGIKACAEYLGVCFRPLADQALEAALAKGEAAQPPVQRPPAEDRGIKHERPSQPPADAAGPESDSGSAAGVDPAAVEKALAEAKAAIARTNAALMCGPSTAGSAAGARAPLVPPGTSRKQASLKCNVKEFDRLCIELAKGNPRYRLPSGQPDKAHMLYTLHAVGFPVLTDANLEPAFEAAARHAAGLPTAPAAQTATNGSLF